MRFPHFRPPGNGYLIAESDHLKEQLRQLRALAVDEGRPLVHAEVLQILDMPRPRVRHPDRPSATAAENSGPAPARAARPRREGSKTLAQGNRVYKDGMQDGAHKRFFGRIQEVLVGPQYRVLFDDGECETCSRGIFPVAP